MGERQYGFGIVGLGAIAATHAKAIASLKEGKLVACLGRTLEKATAFCLSHGGIPYGDMKSFLSNPDLDIVTIATPSGAHLDVALAALEAGKAVVVEKPMEVTTARIDLLIRSAKEHHALLSGIFQSRFLEAPMAVKDAVEKGRFGKISLLSAQVAWFRGQEYYDKVEWHGTLALDGGGVLMNQAIHAIDLLCWFGGPVEEVYGSCACLSHERIEVEDSAVATLRFASGALGVISASTGSYPGFPKRIMVCGDRGSAVLEEENLVSWNFREESEDDEEIRRRYIGNGSNGGASDPLAIGFLGHAREFQNVIDALKRHAKSAITGEEARVAVRVIEAIYQSSREGRPIKVEG